MAKIRHIAIKVEDQEKAATFYKETFGMTEAWRGPVRDDGKRAIDHFGFQVEDMEETRKTAGAAGAQGDATKKPRDGRFAEVGVHDPSGQSVDVSVHGWKA